MNDNELAINIYLNNLKINNYVLSKKKICTMSNMEFLIMK